MAISSSPASNGFSAQWNAWYRAARPRSLTATYVPLGLAAVIALGENTFNGFLFVLSLIAALSLQVAANLINEYADFVRGSDEGKVAGMGMVIKDAVLTPRRVLIGAVLTLLIGIVIGLFLVTQSGPALLWIGAAGVLVVILYTAGPAPLAYLGLGEVAVFIFMGPLMVYGAYYVIVGGKPTDTGTLTCIMAALPIGFLVANILHANNLRDMDADRAANKRTLAVRFGLRFAREEYVFWTGGAYALLLMLAIIGWVPPGALIAMLTGVEAYRLVQLCYSTTDPLKLHQLQGRTARLHRNFGALMIIGWLVQLIVLAVSLKR